MNRFSFFIPCLTFLMAFMGILLPHGFLLSWTLPMQISDSGINFNPHAAFSAGGNAEVVWTKGTYPNLYIQSSTFSQGSWSAPVIISSIGVNDGAQIAVDAAGNAVAVWCELFGGSHLTRAASKPIGGSWSAPVTISTGTRNYFQKVAMNANGNAISGWIDYNTNTVEVAHLTFGGAWGNPMVISTVAGIKSSLTVGIDSSDNGFATWVEGIAEDIYASNSNGNIWGPPVNLNKNGNNGSPALSVGAPGQCLAAWNNNEVLEVRAAWCNNGTWSFIPRIISSDAVGAPAIAALSGNGFAAWLNQNTGAVQVTNYTSGEWVYPPYDASSSTNNGNPTASIDATNTAIIAWSNFAGGTIESIRFSSGGVPEAPQAISGFGDHYFPASASAGTNSIVTWQSLVGTDWLIFVNIN